MRIINNTTGLCSKCQKIKVLDEFSKTVYSSNGYRSWCKQCEAKNYRQRYIISKTIKPKKLKLYRKKMLIPEERTKLRALWRKAWYRKVELGYVKNGHYSKELRLAVDL